MSYTGPATFLAFALMTLMVLPTAFVYAEFSTMLPSTGSCLVFNTIGINKHAGFWSAWLIMCSWVAVPAAGVLGILQWINYQFGVNLHGPGFVLAGILMLIAWCLLSLYKNVVAGRVQSFMLFAGIGRATWMGFIGYMGVGLILWLYMVLFRWKHDKVWMKTPDGKMEF